MEKNDFDKGKFLYDIAVSHEVSTENPDDISLSIRNMLADIRSLGYADFHHLADVKLRKIHDPRIMAILLKYYIQMDLYTRDSLMYKIHPKHFPEAISIAKTEFLALGPTSRMTLNGFQTAMSKAQITEQFLDEMFALLSEGENYAYLSDVRKVLCKKAPDRMLPLIERYSDSVLVLCVIEDCKHLANIDYAIGKLEVLAAITDEEIKQTLLDNKQDLSVTTYQYFCNLCSASRIQAEAKVVLRKLQKRAK